jgi:FecR-like protein
MNESARVEIERYLAGGMSPGEAADFLAAVRRDPEALEALGLALVDEAHFFDLARAAAPAEKSHETTRRIRKPRLRFASRPTRGVDLFWVGAAAAAIVFALLVFAAPSRPRPVVSPAIPVAVETERPSPPPPPSPRPPSPPPREIPRPPMPTPVPRSEAVPAPPPAVPPPREETPPPPRRDPAPPPASDPPRPLEPVKKTQVAIATLDRAQGECVTIEADVETAVKAGASILSGQGLRTGASGSLAAVKYPDATRLDLGPGTSIRELAQGPGGKRVRLAAGTLSADVAKQPAGAPLVVSTPQAEVLVVGTRFTISCTAGSTKVEVREGRVKVTRIADGTVAELLADQFAVVEIGTTLAPRPMPIDDILLLPAQGRIVGADWRAVKDPDAAGGVALDAPRSRNGPLQDAPCVVFTCVANADRTYYVWVRGKCLAKTNPIEHDGVIVEFSDSEVTEPPGVNQGKTGSRERGLFNGFMHHAGYGWVGSDSDQGRDVAPVTVRFSKPGRQTVKLYAYEGPLRIDALWLSAAQKTRPDDAQAGPPPEKK